MPRLSVRLVAWNGAKYIPYLFESLRNQTYKVWELLAIDNNSTKDNTADLIGQELKDFPVPARLIRNKENNGFAGGHNQAVREGSGVRGQGLEYFQLLNQDMYLAPDYFEKVVAMMDSHPEAGAGQGLLLRWCFEEMQSHNPSQPPLTLRGGECGLTDVIDTMGLKVLRNRRVVDWRTGETLKSVIASEAKQSHGQGEEIATSSRGGGTPRDDNAWEVFGVSGALPVYRRKAIEEVMFEGNMFDDEFGSYKEDVDLAFRLRSAGWKAYVEPRAHAWHDRTAAGPREMSDQTAMKNRKGRPTYVSHYSYRNHIVVLLKNEHRANFVKDWPAIFWYELKKFLFMLLFDRETLKGLREVKKLWPRIMRKRTHIMANYKVKPEEMREWFV